MNLSALLNNVTIAVKDHSPEILTAFGVGGVISTSYLVGKASFESAEIIRQQEDIGGTHGDTKERFKERARFVWKKYIPAAISGAVTIGCIVASRKLSSQKTAAAVTAYSLTEKAYSEYKEKVTEELKERKEQKIRDEIAQQKIISSPGGSEINISTGKVLCCELYTQRYFESDMESLRKAQNDVNGWVINSRRATLDDFYSLIGLTSTQVSGDLGWEDDELMELKFSSVLTDSGAPCLAFEYNYVKPF